MVRSRNYFNPLAELNNFQTANPRCPIYNKKETRKTAVSFRYTPGQFPSYYISGAVQLRQFCGFKRFYEGVKERVYNQAQEHNQVAKQRKEAKTMDISDQISSGFIKVPDLAAGPRRAAIASVRPGRFERPDVEFQDGSILSLNATNMRILARAWGTETDAWTGKEVELYVGQTEFQGQKRDSVLVRAISPDIPKGQQPKPKPAAGGGRDPMDDAIPF
jgi:hypothetical protein